MTQCRTCKHPRRREIDRELQMQQLQLPGAMSLSSIAEKFETSKSSLFRHQKSGHHLATETSLTENSEEKIHSGFNAELKPRTEIHDSARFKGELYLAPIAPISEKPTETSETGNTVLEEDVPVYEDWRQIFSHKLSPRVKKDLYKQAAEKHLPPPRFNNRELHPVAYHESVLSRIISRDASQERRAREDAAASIPLWEDKTPEQQRRILERRYGVRR